MAQGICTTCGFNGKLYAKGLCQKCYAAADRIKHLEKRREYDRLRQKTERRRDQDKARHARDKEKRNTRCRQYRANNLEKLQEYDRMRYRDQDRRAYMQAIRQKNIERIREVDRQEYRRNKDRHIARVMARRAHRGKATPKWLTNDQQQQMMEMYANRLEGFHIDHIIPLKGKDVCGLHVPWNLQYLPATENLRKGNR